MKYLLDASALVEIFLKIKAEKLISVLKECCILDLTIYEFCNSLWKLTKIRKRISEETALMGAKLLEKIISIGGLKVISGWSDLEEQMRKSLKHFVNAYDMAYINTTIEKNLILVTEDTGMYNNAKKVFKLEVKNTEELLKRST